MPELRPFWEGGLFSAWSAGALLAVIAAVYVLARKKFLRPDPLGIFLGAAGGLAISLLALYLAQLTHEGDATRQALEAREQDLSTKAWTLPALSCVDFITSELIEDFCEKALFIGPAEIAAAASYISARLALFRDESLYARSNIEAFHHSRAALERAVDRDRFGLYAHVLAVEYECTPTACDLFAFVPDSTRLRANLRRQVFDALLSRYAATWPTAPQTTGSPQVASQPVQRPTPLRGLDLPPAGTSIPPVSIMNPEPTVPSAASPPPEAGRQNQPGASGQPRARQSKPQNIVPGSQ